MKTDSKSGLCIQQALATVITILLIGVITNLITYTKSKIEVANLNNNVEQAIVSKQEEVQIAQTEERKTETTSRTLQEEREIVTQENEMEVIQNNEDTENYKKIEEISISRDMDLSKRCGISKEDFRTLMANLKTDSSGFFETNADLIYDVCEKYEINEIFFCGLIAAESGWNIASNHRNKNNYISMMSKGSMIRYATVEDGLEAAAKLLHNNYLTPGGSCYYGKTLSCVQRRFCPNSSTWVGLVYGCMSQVVK